MNTGHQLWLDLRCGTESWAFYTGQYDQELIESASKVLESHKLIIDVGANIGFWSIPLGLKAKKCHCAGVIAFEPSPSNRARLLRNVSLNGLNGVVQIRDVGLSSAKGFANLTLREEFEAGAETGNAALAIDKTDLEKFSCIRVELSTLDEELSAEQQRTVGLIKVDIEGHEDFFLRGARQTLNFSRPIVVSELNQHYFDQRGVTAADVIGQALEGLDYSYLRKCGKTWTEVTTFSSPAPLDDLILVPQERAEHVTALLNR